MKIHEYINNSFEQFQYEIRSNELIVDCNIYEYIANILMIRLNSICRYKFYEIHFSAFNYLECDPCELHGNEQLKG